MTKKFDRFINFIAWSFYIAAHLKAEKYFLTDKNGASGLSKEWKFDAFNSSYTCSNSWSLPTTSRKPIEWTTCLPSSPSKLVQYCVLKSLVYNLNGANAVFINVTLKITTCKSLNVTNCYEYFTFSIYTGSKEDPPNKLSFETTLPSNLTQFSSVSEYIRSAFITVSDTEGENKMQLAFSANNFCGILIELSMYAYRCPSSTNDLASFPEEAAPNITNSPKVIFGECLENSISENKLKPSMKCYFNGTYKVYSECECNKGFEPKTFSCKACDSNHFKPNVGNVPCQECGSNSVGVLTSCTCSSGFYRILGQEMNSTAACYKPTSPPQNVTIYNITEYSAFIAWAIPNDESLFDGYYYIECLSCSIQDIFPRNTTEQQITLDGLGSYSEYNLTISYINSISLLTGKYQKYAFNFKTKPGAPGVVRDVTVKINNDGSVTISWVPPFWKGGANLKYILRYNGFQFVTVNTYFDVKPGTQDKSYTIEIMGVVVTNDGSQLTGPIHKETFTIKGGIKLDILIGTACGAFAFILIVLIIIFITWKKLHPQYLQAVRLEDGTVKMPANRFMNRGKLYIDPTTYNEVEDAVQKFAFELDRKNIKSGHLLGGGEFAEVYKGTLLQNGKSIDVAIKMLKSGATKNDRADFFGEAAILGQFNNQNVIHLHGVILKDRPNIIVLEFMINGALDKFLQENDMQFTILQLLGMARGVASGMKYLSEMGFIHRDLAARNILVDEAYCCKVADFGMSRKINIDDSYDTKGGKIPVRWTAPESVQFKKFTSASDMWSYGVLLWEIVSYGERPYWDWGNYEVLERINSGYRLPPPMGSPKLLHNLMLQCWDKDRFKRPKFSEVVSLLEGWIRNPELLAETATSIVTKSDENLDYTVLQSIGKWLEAIGMEKYLKNFTEKGISTPRQLLGLTLEDLEKIGIGPIGHRKKIFKAIQSTRVQIEAIDGN